MISFSSNLRNSLFWESSHTLLKSSKLEFIFSLLRNIHLLPIILTEGDVWAALENKTLSLSLEGDNSASTTQIYPEMQGTHARDKLAFLLCWLRHPHITQHQSSSQTLKQCANSKSAIKKKKKKRLRTNGKLWYTHRDIRKQITAWKNAEIDFYQIWHLWFLGLALFSSHTLFSKWRIIEQCSQLQPVWKAAQGSKHLIASFCSHLYNLHWVT